MATKKGIIFTIGILVAITASSFLIWRIPLIVLFKMSNDNLIIIICNATCKVNNIAKDNRYVNIRKCIHAESMIENGDAQEL